MVQTVNVAQVIDAQLISTVGWRALFDIGGALPLLLAAALFVWLPESIRLAALLPHGQAEAKRLLAKIKPNIGSDVLVPTVGGLMLATGLDAKHVYLVCIVPALVGAVSMVLLRWRAIPLPQPVRAV